jgi:hypothetical protein
MKYILYNVDELPSQNLKKNKKQSINKSFLKSKMM